jgi:hypothetical protein
MTARSKRLAGPIDLSTTSDVVVYTVPAGMTALVKSIRGVTHSGPNTGGAILNIGIGGTGGGALFCKLQVPYQGQAVDSDVEPVVLRAGETLVARHSGQSGMSTCTLTVSGAELVA